APGVSSSPRRPATLILPRTSHRRSDGACYERSRRSETTRRTDDHVHVADSVRGRVGAAADVHAELVADVVAVLDDAARFFDGEIFRTAGSHPFRKNPGLLRPDYGARAGKLQRRACGACLRAGRR